ncbi:riboflavin kinase/FMN adenylyltransferase [Flavobacteriaceae bacterium MAR_2010_72]|nr:riboflavin kinase/FMN adenylyltransferase [Flavobacteriaceae bacterium MAR_2010_72]
MELHKTLKSYKNEPSVITIGTFDGVHIGHQKIIKRLIERAKEKKLSSLILTFFPHPRAVLQSSIDIKLLHTIDERKDMLSHLGLDHLIIKKFTKEFARYSAEQYVREVLVEELNAKHIIIGYDHRFGKKRSADIKDLIKYGHEYGFDVEQISAQDIEDVAVSSTKIRNALIHGDIKTANSYLGYNYFLNGKVIRGKQIGKQIGFPTANIYIKEDYKLIPKNGVYVVKCTLNNKLLFGMMNIGTNPTVDGSSQSIEVHFFDFDSTLYDQHLKIELLERLRNERKFESLEALQQQLQKDQAAALEFLKVT